MPPFSMARGLASQGKRALNVINKKYLAAIISDQLNFTNINKKHILNKLGEAQGHTPRPSGHPLGEAPYPR
jgi:hypothetical protein